MANMKQKCTKREAALIERLKKGELLCAERTDEAAAARHGGMRYWFEPSQQPCGPGTAFRCISKGVVAPVSSALFAGIVGQSYGLSATEVRS
jgi:hypothetical protein